MTEAHQRIDRWLWFSRQFKTRTLAAKMVTSGHIRINHKRITKASHLVQVDDTITFVTNKKVKVLKVAAIGARRGPAVEAMTLYHDLSPVETPKTKEARKAVTSGQREEGAGRPTKKQRREIDALMDRGA